MNKKSINKQAVIVWTIGIIAIIVILWHAFSVVKSRTQGEDDQPSMADSETIWVEETQLESDKDISVALAEAVLGNSQQKKNLEVFEQKISDITKLTDSGKIWIFKINEKYQYVKYSGTAIYTVDLSGIDEEHLTVDEENKTLTIYIPHAVHTLNINEDETIAEETENKGLFSIGDLKLTEEGRKEVIAEVKENMEAKLESDNIQETADRMAVMSVWEIYQPVVSKVSPEYTVVVEFA